MLTFIPYHNHHIIITITHDTRSLVSSAVQVTTNPAAVVPRQRLGSSAEFFSGLLFARLSSIRPGLLIFSLMSLHLASSLLSPLMSRYLLLLHHVAACWHGIEWPFDPGCPCIISIEVSVANAISHFRFFWSSSMNAWRRMAFNTLSHLLCSLSRELLSCDHYPIVFMQELIFCLIHCIQLTENTL